MRGRGEKTEKQSAHSENNRDLPGELVFPHVVFRFLDCKVTGTAHIIQKQRNAYDSKETAGKGAKGTESEKSPDFRKERKR